MSEDLFSNRRWLIIPTAVTSSIDFSQVHQSSIDTLRLSVDRQKTFVKYDINVVTASYSQSFVHFETGEIKTFTVEAGTYGRPSVYLPSYQECTYSEILEILATSEWTVPIEGMLP